MAAPDNQLACVYAALVLHDDGIPITEDKIKSLIDAAGVKVEPYFPAMYAKLLETVEMDTLINNIGAAPAAGGGGGGGGAAAGGGDEAPAEEEKKEESEEEEEEDMDFDLFD